MVGEFRTLEFEPQSTEHHSLACLRYTEQTEQRGLPIGQETQASIWYLLQWGNG